MKYKLERRGEKYHITVGYEMATYIYSYNNYTEIPKLGQFWTNDFAVWDKLFTGNFCIEFEEN